MSTCAVIVIQAEAVFYAIGGMAGLVLLLVALDIAVDLRR